MTIALVNAVAFVLFALDMANSSTTIRTLEADFPTLHSYAGIPE